MSYLIRNTAGTLLTELQEQTADIASTPLTLIGRAYYNYGEALNDNLVHMLENFALGTAPAHALVGQLWYNATTNTMSLLNTSNAWEALASQAWINSRYVSVSDFNAGTYASQAWVNANFERIADLTAHYATIDYVHTNYLSANQTITVSGDASAVGTTALNLVLTPSGVTAGSYQHVTVDAKGRVVAGSALTAGDISTALGYVPASSSVMTGVNIATFAYGALGNVAGNSVQMLDLTTTNNSTSHLHFWTYRNQNGTSWTSASSRLQLTTDVSLQGYIEFNPATHNGGIALGANNGMLLTSYASTFKSVPDTGIEVFGPFKVANGNLHLNSTTNSNIWFCDNNDAAVGVIYWDVSSGTMRLSANTDGSATIMIKNDGSIHSTGFILTNGGSENSGLYGVSNNTMNLRVGALDRIVIANVAAGSPNYSQVFNFGPPSSGNGSGSYSLNLDNSGAMTRYTYTSGVSVNTFSIDAAGNLVVPSTVSGTTIYSKTGLFVLEATDYIRNGSGTIVGTTGTNIFSADKNGTVNANFGYNGQGSYTWSASPTFDVSGVVNGFNNIMNYDSNGKLTVPGSIIGSQFMCSDLPGSDTGMANPSDGTLTLLSNSIERFHIDVNGSTSLYFADFDRGPTNFNSGAAPYYEFAWQTDRNVVLYAPVYDAGGNAMLDPFGNELKTAIWTTATTTSDARLKENVLDLDDGMAVINALRPVTFSWTKESGLHDDLTHTGFLAQDVEILIPDAVVKIVHDQGSETFLLHKQEIIPHLVKALQQVAKEKDGLAKRIHQLEQKIELILAERAN